MRHTNMTLISAAFIGLTVMLAEFQAEAGAKNETRMSTSPSFASDASILFNAIASTGLEPGVNQEFSTASYSVKDIWCRRAGDLSKTCGLWADNVTFDDDVSSWLFPVISRLGSKRIIADDQEVEYEIKNVVCAKTFQPSVKHRCRMDLPQADASIIFDALEAAGVDLSTEDGQPIYGATRLAADALYCGSKKSRKRDDLIYCGVQSGSLKSDITDTDLKTQLMQILSRLAKNSSSQNNENSSQYILHRVICTMGHHTDAQAACRMEAAQ